MENNTGSMVGSAQPTESIVELFHMVKSLIPEGQQVVTVTPHTTVAAAMEKMRTGEFSQVPVVSGKAVLGVFSYRSLSRRMVELGPINVDFRELPVDEFMEQFTFVQPTDKWVTILSILDREDGVLVGNRDDLRGILTSMDVLTYLHRIASPFVMLAEIEMSLRQIIGACVDEGGLHECAANSLSQIYTAEEMPSSLSDMTFSDYVQIIGDGRNWPRFEAAFGSGGWLRRQTVVRLSEVRELRNDTFHFRRRLDEYDYATLMQHRDWLEMKARSFEGQKREPCVVPQGEPSKNAGTGEGSEVNQGDKRRSWSKEEYFSALATNTRPDVVDSIRDLYEWSLDKADRVRFGTGVTAGSFSFHYLQSGKAISVFTVWTGGEMSLNYGYLRYRLGPEITAQFHQRIITIPTLKRITGDITRFPTISIAVALASPENMESFRETVQWLGEQIHTDD